MTRSATKDKNYQKSILRVSPLSFFTCILLAFFATIAAYLAALATSFRIILSDGNIADRLGNNLFFALHEDENIAAGVLSFLKNFTEHHYVSVFWGILFYLLISYLCIFFASRKNSYVSLKCLSVIFVSSGILLLLTALSALIFRLHTRFTFVNGENTLLFQSFALSGLWIQVAVGLALLAFALLAEFLAITLAKRKVRQRKIMEQQPSGD